MANNRLKSKVGFEIYVITCLVTGKMYVGLTSIGVERRWEKGHLAAALKKTSETILARTIRKYGEKEFTLAVIGTAKTFDEAKALEICKIKELNTLAPCGMNLTPGGEGLSTCIPEVVEKIRQSVNDLWLNTIYVAKHKEAMKVAVEKASYKAARKAAAKAMWGREDYREAQAAAFERSAKQRSESAKEMWKRPGYIEKQNSKDKQEAGRRAALKRWHPEEWALKYGLH